MKMKTWCAPIALILALMVCGLVPAHGESAPVSGVHAAVAADAPASAADLALFVASAAPEVTAASGGHVQKQIPHTGSDMTDISGFYAMTALALETRETVPVITAISSNYNYLSPEAKAPNSGASGRWRHFTHT